MRKNDKRVIFPQGRQSLFLVQAEKQLDFSRQEISIKLNVHPRTYCDWYLERGSMPLEIVRKVCDLTQNVFPENVEIREPFWSVQKAARNGGIQRFKKYGQIVDEIYRKKKWCEWWEKEGKSRLAQNQPRLIRLPLHSEELAEFIGIMLGDGGITKYQITVALGYKSDREYSRFIESFFFKLFRVRPAVIALNKSYIKVQISRKLLVDYCISLGLCMGNKVRQQIDIPSWIKKDSTFMKACIRGLMDTDGCIFQECHKIKKKKYCYPRIYFVNHSRPLRLSVYYALREFDFFPKLRNNRAVSLEKHDDVVRYFSFIGSHNFKHKKRFKMFIGRSA